MFDMIKKKWIEWIVSIVIVFLTVVLTNNVTVKREARSSIQKQIESKADAEWVKQLNSSTLNYIDKQDENLRKSIDQYIEYSKQATEQRAKWIESIDQKLNILVNKTK